MVLQGREITICFFIEACEDNWEVCEFGGFPNQHIETKNSKHNLQFPKGATCLNIHICLEICHLHL